MLKALFKVDFVTANVLFILYEGVKYISFLPMLASTPTFNNSKKDICWQGYLQGQNHTIGKHFPKAPNE
jgi:hypothetical protein